MKTGGLNHKNSLECCSLRSGTSLDVYARKRSSWFNCLVVLKDIGVAMPTNQDRFGGRVWLVGWFVLRLICQKEPNVVMVYNFLYLIHNFKEIYTVGALQLPGHFHLHSP